MTLTDQVAIVTGAGQGIGAGIALALAEAGAHVVVADINGALADKTVDAISVYQKRALAVPADVGNLREIDKIVTRTIEQFGRLDIMVNNAGVTRRADIMDLTEVDWDRIHRVNAKGVFFCLQRAAREMITRGGGRIINIASIAGKGYAGTSNAAYAASKGAVISLTKTAAQQLARSRKASASPKWNAGGPRRFPCDGPTSRRISRRWRCSSPRPARATSPASASMSMAV